MDSIIIYASKHGATKIYSEWICKEMGITCYSIEDISVKRIQQADNIILGSAIYMGHLRITDWMLEYWHHIRDKNLALFTVSGTDPEDPELDKMISNSLPSEYLISMKVFKMPGRLDRSNLEWWEKLMLNMLAHFEKNPEKKEFLSKGKNKIDPARLNELDTWLSELELQSS